MNSILTIFIICLFTFHTYGQNFEYPFVYPPKEPLKMEYAFDENGDTIEIVYDLPIISIKDAIPLANKVDTLQKTYKENFNRGNKLISIETLGCEGGEPYGLKMVERISDIYRDGDLYKVKVPLIENCGIEFGGFIDVKDDTLKLFYGNFSDGITACDCCFTLEFIFESNQSKFNYFFLNEKQIFETDEPYQTFPIKAWVQNGDTIGYLNKYNHKEGWYHYKGDSLMHHDYYEQNKKLENYLSNENGYRVYERCYVQEEYQIHFLTYKYDKKGNLIEWEEFLSFPNWDTETRIYYPNNVLKMYLKEDINRKVIEEKHFKKNGKPKK